MVAATTPHHSNGGSRCQDSPIRSSSFCPRPRSAMGVELPPNAKDGKARASFISLGIRHRPCGAVRFFCPKPSHLLVELFDGHGVIFPACVCAATRHLSSIHADSAASSRRALRRCVCAQGQSRESCRRRFGKSIDHGRTRTASIWGSLGHLVGAASIGPQK